MAVAFLLDTNVVSELTKAVPNRGVAERVQQHESRCAIAAPTLEELEFGISRLAQGRRKLMLQRWLAELIDQFETLPFDAAAAQWLGRERARLADLGQPLPHVDGEIAAVAATRRLVLVTHNTADFSSIAGLALEDWHEAA
jgi:tRNA(fMet)-specific endonuclease VapC